MRAYYTERAQFAQFDQEIICYKFMRFLTLHSTRADRAFYFNGVYLLRISIPFKNLRFFFNLLVVQCPIPNEDEKKTWTRI